MLSCLSLQLIPLSFVLAVRLCLIRNEATHSATKYKEEIFDSCYSYIHQTFIVFYIKSNHLRPIYSGNNKNPAFLPYVTNIDNSNLIENDISIFSILHTYVLQEKLLFNAYMFRLYIKSLLNHSAISNKKVICLLHTRLEYSNLNF